VEKTRQHQNEQRFDDRPSSESVPEESYVGENSGTSNELESLHSAMSTDSISKPPHNLQLKIYDNPSASSNEENTDDGEISEEEQSITQMHYKSRNISIAASEDEGSDNDLSNEGASTEQYFFENNNSANEISEGDVSEEATNARDHKPRTIWDEFR